MAACFAEGSDNRPTQCRQVSDGPQRQRQVASEGPDIGALAASDHEICVVRCQVAPRNSRRSIRTWRDFSSTDLAGAGEIVGPLAVDFQGREGRRPLFDLAQEGRQRRVDGGIARPHVAGRRDLALGVLGRARLAEAQGEAVLLPRVHDEGHGLGRLAQRDRQDAAGQRIERAAMAGLLCAEQPAHAADRRRRAQPDRLVEHDPAVDLVAFFRRTIAARPWISSRPFKPTKRCAPAVASGRLQS